MPSPHDHEKDIESPQLDLDAQPGFKEVQDLQMVNSLPSPVVASPIKQSKLSLSATTVIPIWICLSSSVIIYNNYLYNTLNFKYPVFTVTWHLTFAVSLPYLSWI
jgi:hypothetical protein